MVGCAFYPATRQVTHTSSQSAQRAQRAPICDGGKPLLGCLAWGNMHWEWEPVVVAVLNSHFHGNPNLDASADPSVPEFGRHLATGRAPHQPHTASSTASQCCQPYLTCILLFSVAQSQTASLGGAQCARPWPIGRLVQTHQAHFPARPTRRSVNTSCFS